MYHVDAICWAICVIIAVAAAVAVMAVDIAVVTVVNTIVNVIVVGIIVGDVGRHGNSIRIISIVYAIRIKTTEEVATECTLLFDMFIRW